MHFAIKPKTAKVNKTLRGRMNFKGRLLKKHVKVTKKLIKNRCKFTIKKKYAKKRPKIWFWKVLASIWEGFGTLWAALWSLLGAFWRFFGLSKSYLVKALVQDGPQEAFWMDFGSLWKGFGTVWEGFGEEFGRIWSLLSKEWTDFGYAWHDLALLQQSL